MTMAIAKKCDRCGKYHDIYNDKENPHSIIPANANFRNQYYSHKIINLCPDCMNELKKWLENK